MTGANSVSGEIFDQIEEKEFEFCSSGKCGVIVDDFIGDALSSLPPSFVKMIRLQFLKQITLRFYDFREEILKMRKIEHVKTPEKRKSLLLKPSLMTLQQTTTVLMNAAS